MKRVRILVPFLLMYNLVNAQTSGEWFNQKKTQKKYLINQIAALQVYIGYAKKGYEHINTGLTTIKKIKSGDFNLHSEFLSGKKRVNPNIKNSGRIIDIIVMQIRLVNIAKESLKLVRQKEQFTSTEIEHCKKVFDYLLEDCVKNMDLLSLITTSGEVDMKDDERIKRIDLLYDDMQETYSFARNLSHEMNLLSIQRISEQVEINTEKQLNTR